MSTDAIRCVKDMHDSILGGRRIFIRMVNYISISDLIYRKLSQRLLITTSQKVTNTSKFNMCIDPGHGHVHPIYQYVEEILMSTQKYKRGARQFSWETYLSV